mgnify:CR=1 FL=1
MFGMTISSSQAKTLVDFINSEKANYIEEKVKRVPSEKNAMEIYKEIHANLEEIKHYATDIIKYARCHSGTMSTPNVYPLPYHKDSDIGDPWNCLLYTSPSPRD